MSAESQVTGGSLLKEAGQKHGCPGSAFRTASKKIARFQCPIHLKNLREGGVVR